MVQWYEVGTKTINVQLEELQPVVTVEISAGKGTVNVHWKATNPGWDDAVITFSSYVDGKSIASDTKSVAPKKTIEFDQAASVGPGDHEVRVVAELEGRTILDKTVTVTVGAPWEIKSWDVALDKTKAKPGDTVNLVVTVNWEAPGSVQFKTKVTAFGQTFESQAVLATTSPFAFKVPLTVPTEVDEGNYTIAVTLLVGV